MACNYRSSTVPACSQAPLGASCCCCKFCEVGGCDIRVMTCGCCLHTRCCPIVENQPITECPICLRPVTALQLLPMNFQEIDHAKEQASVIALSDKRGKKRKNATIARLSSSGALTADETLSSTAASISGGAASTTAGESNDLRTGRWTTEETEYCDSLIRLFEQGKLPIPEGLKLNEFLANMLKSKQSRLTKKMKNARLSARQYHRATGYIASINEAKTFSQLETEFFASIKCPLERSEIRFHMQKEWRELFSTYCVSLGQVLDANDWLFSVEELERRASKQKDAERMVRRKVMMGHALSYDLTNSSQRGVHIEAAATSSTQQSEDSKPSAVNNSSTKDSNATSGQNSGDSPAGASVSTLDLARQDKNPMKYYAAPFISKIMHFIKRHRFPFEHVDAWVPSYVPPSSDSNTGEENNNTNNQGEQKCRLCFAGCATAENKISLDNTSEEVPLTDEEKFNLVSFGVYSQKFSFDVGCGLPGRVYSSGIASWEQGIQNAPLAQFERCGGAAQWGIQTVLGIPIPSPSVGRIVVLFYSIYDRQRNFTLVNRIAEDLGKMRPSPKWKLVVDVGVADPTANNKTEEVVPVHQELLTSIMNCTPIDKTSPLSVYLPGFTSLKLLLTKTDRTDRDDELLNSIISCYESYKLTGRSEADIASMTARDFMLLLKQYSESPIIQGQQQTTNGVITATTNQNKGYNQHKSPHDQQQHPPPLYIQPFQQPQQHQQQAHILQQQTMQPQQAHMQRPSEQQQQQQQQHTTVTVEEKDLLLEQQQQQQRGALSEIDSKNLNDFTHFALSDPFNSLAASPALQPIPTQNDTGLNTLRLTASQISALLQNDANINFQGL